MKPIKKLKKELKTKPMPFQLKGIKFLFEHNGRAILADDMGLGKTLQALGLIALYKPLSPVLIVCPANAKYNWLEQIETHTRALCASVLNGRTPREPVNDIWIINYDILSYWGEFLLKNQPQLIILDEVHYTKNRKAARTKAALSICKKAPHIIPMSGTPIINSPAEFYPALKMIDDSFMSFWKFAMRYCGARQTKWGWDVSGASHIEELHEILKTKMIRRTKAEVLKELPQKQRIRIVVDISNKKEYKFEKENFIRLARQNKEYVGKAKKALALVKLTQLLQIVADGKLREAFCWIDEFLETTDQKLVVFCRHKNIMQALSAKYKKILALGGAGLSGEEKQKQVNKFQNNKQTRIYLGTIKADGTAITLTAASVVLFVELGWTPAEHEQAEDRVNRIGQLADSISAYYLIGKDTIDEDIWEVLQRKREIIAQVIDGKTVKDDSILALLGRIK